MNVVYSSDNHYARHAGVSMVSLFENNRHAAAIDVYMVDNGIRQENRSKLEAVCRQYGRTIRFLPLALIEDKLRLDLSRSPISISAYARLFLAGLLPASIDRVLYFDCDAVVHAPIDALWQTDLKGAYAAGVLDTVGEIARRKVDLATEQTYVNSGMLLIDLKRWREERIEQRFLSFIDDRGGQVHHHDQGVINGVLSDGLLRLHPKYNAMTVMFTMTREQLLRYYGMADYYSQAELAEAVAKPVFVHYTPAFAGRPWVKGNRHPLRELYGRYLGLSPWRGTEEEPDRRSRGERGVAFLYNTLPFPLADGVKKALFG